MATFGPKTPTETERFTMDFTRILAPATIITGGTVTCSALEGTDPSAGSVPSNPLPAPSDKGQAGKCLTVLVGATVDGVHYLLTFKPTTNDGTTPELAGDFWCSNPFT